MVQEIVRSPQPRRSSVDPGMEADWNCRSPAHARCATCSEPKAAPWAASHMTNTIWPYLLRTLAIERSNHVWAMDITYITMARGFVYLAAVIEWHSRRVLAWRLSISMDTVIQ